MTPRQRCFCQQQRAEGMRVLSGFFEPLNTTLATRCDPLIPHSRERHQQRTKWAFAQITLAERVWFVVTFQEVAHRVPLDTESASAASR